METTQILEHGQIVLPESVLRVYLTSKVVFAPTRLEDVAGCLRYAGSTKTLEEMEHAISEGVRLTYANFR